MMNYLSQNHNKNTNQINHADHQSSFNTNKPHAPQTRVTKPNPTKQQIDAQTIFSDPSSASDPRWFWRTMLESIRSDHRNIKYYVNYVGSKGARSYENNSRSSDKKPDHYKKHVAKIGCPLHDLHDIFHKDLGFTVNPTICAHKSWKCPNLSSFSNYRTLATVSMNEIGLEWKRSAFSVKPLHIKYGNIFSTDLYIKRIANTNFNKVFRPGCFGNLPSVKKGSWKQGKVFYVFKNDKLILNIGDSIILVFELSSPSTIIKSNKNKHDIIDGWKNIVGGVGFYTCADSKQNIATVLILRKSVEFPIECLQQSKIKILLKNNGNYGSMYDKKLIIGSHTFDLNGKCKNNNDIMDSDYLSISTSPSVLNNNDRHGRDNDRNRHRGCNSNSSEIERSRSRSRGRNGAVHSYGDECSDRSDRSVRSWSTLSYDNNVVNTLPNVSSTYSPSTISMEHNYNSPYYNNYTETKQCDENNVDYKLQTIINTMKGKFEHDNSILTQRNQLLNGKVGQLKTLNAQFMDLNSKLMHERDELLSQIQTLQRQKQMMHNMNQPQPMNVNMNEPNCVMNSNINPMINQPQPMINMPPPPQTMNNNMNGQNYVMNANVNSIINQPQPMNNINAANYMAHSNIPSPRISNMSMNGSINCIHGMDNHNMDINSVNFNHTTNTLPFSTEYDDNNSTFTTNPMFYGTYTEFEGENNEFQLNSEFF